MENTLNHRVEQAPINNVFTSISDKVHTELAQSKGGWDVLPGANNSMESGMPIGNSSILNTQKDSPKKPDEKPSPGSLDTNDHGVLLISPLQFSKPQDTHAKPAQGTNAEHTSNNNDHGPETVKIKPGSFLDNFMKSPDNAKPAEKPAQDPTAEINFNANKHWRSL